MPEKAEVRHTLTELQARQLSTVTHHGDGFGDPCGRGSLAWDEERSHHHVCIVPAWANYYFGCGSTHPSCQLPEA